MRSLRFLEFPILISHFQKQFGSFYALLIESLLFCTATAHESLETLQHEQADYGQSLRPLPQNCFEPPIRSKVKVTFERLIGSFATPKNLLTSPLIVVPNSFFVRSKTLRYTMFCNHHHHNQESLVFSDDCLVFKWSVHLGFSGWSNQRTFVQKQQKGVEDALGYASNNDLVS